MSFILKLLEQFPHLSIFHISRDFNDQADALSRRSIFAEEGSIHFELWVDDHLYIADRLLLYNYN